jgi:hypothetical protein
VWLDILPKKDRISTARKAKVWVPQPKCPTLKWFQGYGYFLWVGKANEKFEWF